MIIKDNFNSKSVDPRDDDYKEIGKGSMNTDKKLEQPKVYDPFKEYDEKTNRDNDDMSDHDKWEFFK